MRGMEKLGYRVWQGPGPNLWSVDLCSSEGFWIDGFGWIDRRPAVLRSHTNVGTRNEAALRGRELVEEEMRERECENDRWDAEVIWLARPPAARALSAGEEGEGK